MSYRKRVFGWTLGAVGLIFAAASTQAATFFVSTTGTDNGSCGTSASPATSACRTIQHAYDNRANAGDEIRVLPGTYAECVQAIPFANDPPKPVRIVATDWLANANRATTILTGNGICDGTLFSDAVVVIGGNGASLEGFTIREGGRSGVFATGGVAITSNIITENVSDFGGGVLVYANTCTYGNVTAEVRGNSITNNAALFVNANLSGGEGGGIDVFADATAAGGGCVGGSATVTVAENSVTGNFADARGGGIGIFTQAELGSTATVDVSTNAIRNNSMTPYSGSTEGVIGAGLWASTSGQGTESIRIFDNTPTAGCPTCGVTNNVSDGDAGGLSAQIRSFPTSIHTLFVDGNRVDGNVANGNGGGLDVVLDALDLSDSARLHATVSNNTIANNTASAFDFLRPFGGGGLFASIFATRSANPATMRFNIVGNTITDNLAEITGGGVSFEIVAEADEALGGSPPAAPALAHIGFSNNLVAGNIADDSTDISVGGGVSALLQAFGQATASLGFALNTVADNETDAGSAGVEIESFTGCDTAHPTCASTPGSLFHGRGFVTVDGSIIASNLGGAGIGGPRPGTGGIFPGGTGNLRVEVTNSNLFGNTGGAFEATLTDPNPPPADPPALREPGNTNSTVNPQLAAVTYSHGLCRRIGRASTSSLADLNDDDFVDGIDVLRLSVAFGARTTAARYTALADVDGNGIVDGDDLALIVSNIGDNCP